MFFLWLAISTPRSLAILFNSTGDPAYDTAAPTGVYANSGWQYEGEFGSYLATAIAPDLIITAAHIGASSTFTADTIFTGQPTVTYSINTSANGGLGYWAIAGTDLVIYQINGTLSSWAPLYTGTLTSDTTEVITGRGGPRGSAIAGGWSLGTSDNVARWGTSAIVGYADGGSGLGQVLVSNFNPSLGAQSGYLSGGDSGGGDFIYVNGQWQLAGINYGVQQISTNADGSSPFSAAISNMSGYYVQNDAGQWVLASSLGITESSFYSSSISASATQIDAVISAVPEPGSALLVVGGLAGLGLLYRRRACA